MATFMFEFSYDDLLVEWDVLIANLDQVEGELATLKPFLHHEDVAQHYRRLRRRRGRIMAAMDRVNLTLTAYEMRWEPDPVQLELFG